MRAVVPIENFNDAVRGLLSAQGLPPHMAAWGALAAGVAALLILAWLVNLVAKRVILRAVTLLVKQTSFHWDDALLETGFFTRLSHLAPAMAINTFGDDFLGNSPQVLVGVGAAVDIYLIVIWLLIFFAFLNALVLAAHRSGHGDRMPVKGFVQAFKLVASLVALILVLATILNKSPIYLFSGLGALTAVLLLVFRDAILGFVAGIMISANNLVRVGDWIEIPKAGADGDVIDVSLTTVKVQNWDRTITTIPTYTLISDSFKNWRGMNESGGRRIKRAIHLDLQSIRFADEAMIERWKRITLLRPYLEEKRRELEQANQESKADLSVLGNGRRLTNVGTFRAYCIAYLQAHPQIRQDMTFLIRQLRTTEHGLPLEVYVFSKDIRWANYEAIQADIFDHLLAVVGEFDLRVFQQPSGRDLREALGGPGPRPVAEVSAEQ